MSTRSARLGYRISLGNESLNLFTVPNNAVYLVKQISCQLNSTTVHPGPNVNLSQFVAPALTDAVTVFQQTFTSNLQTLFEQGFFPFEPGDTLNLTVSSLLAGDFIRTAVWGAILPYP